MFSCFYNVGFVFRYGLLWEITQSSFSLAWRILKSILYFFSETYCVTSCVWSEGRVEGGGTFSGLGGRGRRIAGGVGEE